jgi:hypothetical protein
MLPSKIATAHTDPQTLANGARNLASATAEKAEHLFAKGCNILKTATATVIDIPTDAIQNSKKLAGSTDTTMCAKIPGKLSA